MQIRTKIAIQFTIIIACILTIFSLAVYYTSENFRKQEFYNRLYDRGILTAQLLKELKITEKDKKKLHFEEQQHTISEIKEPKIIVSFK